MGKFKTTAITRVANISKQDFVDNYFRPQKPIVMTGLTKDWPAYDKWNLDYIRDRAGDQVVPLYDSEPTKGRQNSAVPVTEMKLYDYLELLKKQPTDLRIFFYNILDKMPELLDDFEFPDIGLKFFKRLPAMFFGGAGSQVLAHYDMDLADLIHFHFHGTKRVTLFSPGQSKYLYRVPFSVHNLETIDMANPDFEKYPALRNVEALQATLNHGDAIFMPSGYWHYIQYLDAGFSITLRALPTKPRTLMKTAYNVIFMRNFENLMRRSIGQKWIDYKDRLTVRKTERNLVSRVGS